MTSRSNNRVKARIRELISEIRLEDMGVSEIPEIGQLIYYKARGVHLPCLVEAIEKSKSGNTRIVCSVQRDDDPWFAGEKRIEKLVFETPDGRRINSIVIFINGLAHTLETLPSDHVLVW